MYETGDSQRVTELLGAFDATLLEKAGCYLGGGAALVLALGEYRQLNNVNFICASAEGYRLLRNTVQDTHLGALLTRSLPIVREVRTSAYVVSTFLDVQGAPTKVDFAWEIRVAISGTFDAAFGVPGSRAWTCTRKSCWPMPIEVRTGRPEAATSLNWQ